MHQRHRLSRAIVVVTLIGSIARAQSGEPVRPAGGPKLASILAGVARAIVPMAVGGGIPASAELDDTARRRAGLDVLAAGFAVAPVVSHLVAREWWRAAIFGVTPVACAVGAIALLESDPSVLDTGTTPRRI